MNRVVTIKRQQQGEQEESSALLDWLFFFHACEIDKMDKRNGSAEDKF